MKRTAMASLLGLLFSSNSYAAPLQFQTDDVIVTASRIPQLKENVIGDTSVIKREEIERAGQTTLVELLQSQPGIEIDNNGGPGKTSGLFIRGTSSKNLVILIDGLRIGSSTSGTTTLENIPLAQIERIEILRGPATSLYGQDAIGGVVQLFTRKGTGNLKFNAAAGYGRYNTKTAEAGFSGSTTQTSYSLNLSSYETDGFSSLRTNNPFLKDKDAYRNLSITGSIFHKISENHSLGAQFFSSEGHTNYDSSFNFTNFSNNANLTQLSYALFSKNQLTSNWLSTIRVGEGIDESENFSEINIFNPVSKSLFKTKQRQYSWQNDINLPVGVMTLLYDRLEEKVSSTSAFDNNERKTDGYMVGYLANRNAHSLQVNLRADDSSQFGWNTTGKVGYGYNITPAVKLLGSYGTAFKAPSFNDSFFPFTDYGFGFSYQGNPNLKPEESTNKEISIIYDENKQRLSATVYQNKVNNLIQISQNIPNDSPTNLGSVTLKGLTLAGQKNWQDWQARASIDFQSPRDDETNNLLVRRSQRHASASLAREWGNWRLGAEAFASSSRYNDAANTQVLSGYALLNLTLDYKVDSDWRVQARLNNALDKEYALALDSNTMLGSIPYNTPGTNLFVSVRYAPAK